VWALKKIVWSKYAPLLASWGLSLQEQPISSKGGALFLITSDLSPYVDRTKQSLIDEDFTFLVITKCGGRKERYWIVSDYGRSFEEVFAVKRKYTEEEEAVMRHLCDCAVSSFITFLFYCRCIKAGLGALETTYPQETNYWSKTTYPQEMNYWVDVSIGGGRCLCVRFKFSHSEPKWAFLLAVFDSLNNHFHRLPSYERKATKNPLKHFDNILRLLYVSRI
jgi:hypothetical protein